VYGYTGTLWANSEVELTCLAAAGLYLRCTSLRVSELGFSESASDPLSPSLSPSSSPAAAVTGRNQHGRVHFEKVSICSVATSVLFHWTIFEVSSCSSCHFSATLASSRYPIGRM
jgi:hypothetical protein